MNVRYVRMVRKGEYNPDTVLYLPIDGMVVNPIYNQGKLFSIIVTYIGDANAYFPFPAADEGVDELMLYLDMRCINRPLDADKTAGIEFSVGTVSSDDDIPF